MSAARTCCLAGLLAYTAACGDAATPDTSSPARPEAATASRGSTDAVALLPDVAAEAHVDFVHTHGGTGAKFLFETMGSGVAAADFDGDGLPDLLFVQSGTLPPDDFSAADCALAGHATGTTARLYLNAGTAGGELRFRDATAGSGLDVALYGQGVAVGDVDGDGDRDVYLGCYGRSHLFLNDGHGRFTDTTAQSGIVDPPWTTGGAFFDADGDGDLDLYSVAYLDMPIASHVVCGPSKDIRTYCHVDLWPGLDDHLWINDGTGHFTDGSAAAGLPGTTGKGLAVAAEDLDDDGDLDLFVANDSQANLLLRNDGSGRFTNRARESGTDLNGEGRSEACMGVAAADLDGDGDGDIYVVNFQQERNTLYRNEGGLFFTDVAVSSGAGVPGMQSLGFGVAALDIENDGDLDLYVANGHIFDNVEEAEHGATWKQVDQLYLNDGRGHFKLAPGSWGPSLSEPRVGRGLATADFDRDGDLDLVVSNSNDRPWVLRNDAATGHRIVLRLRGPSGRADAEGAVVRLTAGGRELVRTISPGGSYASHMDTELVIGLGDAKTVDRLSIRWPGAGTSELLSLDADCRYDIAFGGEIVSKTTLPALAEAR